MLRLASVLPRSLGAVFRTRRDLLLENLALRQQLAALEARGRRPRLRAGDRLLWVMLRRLWSG